MQTRYSWSGLTTKRCNFLRLEKFYRSCNSSPADSLLWLVGLRIIGVYRRICWCQPIGCICYNRKHHCFLIHGAFGTQRNIVLIDRQCNREIRYRPRKEVVQNDFSIYSSLLLICIHYTFLIEDSSCFYFHLGARSKRISHKMPSSCCFQIHFRWLSRYAWHRCDTSSEHAIDWL